jgi:hypothetical protein
MNRGLLLTLTRPPPAMSEEFNAWYDQEHLPERLSIPGFRSALRWVLDGTYLATYELDSLAVLSSAPYLARYQNQTPWSRRCLGKCLVFKRWACEQVDPGDAGPHEAARALLFALDDRPAGNALQSRKFAATSGERIALHELGTFEERFAPAYRLYLP